MKKAILSSWLIISFLISFSQTPVKNITIDDIWTFYRFYTRGMQGFQTLQSGDFYTITSKYGIEKHDFATGDSLSMLLDNTLLKKWSNQSLDISQINDYQFDKKEKKILLATDLEYIYRRSTQAFYFVFNPDNQSIISLSDKNLGKQSFATFSPDGNKVAFVRENNLYVRFLDSKKEIQITKDGLENHIKNGLADWVYEEELSLAQAFEWSPDGSKIAWLRFDESRVKEYTLTNYGNLYPQQIKYKYPKAGEDNSLVDVMLYDMVTGKTMKLDLGDHSNCYFPRIHWLPNAQDLLVLKLNRHQNQLDFYRYNVQTQKQDLVFTDRNAAWLEIADKYDFTDDSKGVFLCSERNGYNHIYYAGFDGSLRQITQGNFEVAEICAIDSKNKKIYYLSNESALLNRDLYVIGFDGKKKSRITDGTSWHSVSFSPTNQYFLDNASNLNTPNIYNICKNNGQVIRNLQDNNKLKTIMQDYGFVNRELFQFTTSEGISLNGWMLKPPHFEETKKYPVLMYVYGGPGSQEVRNAWYRGMDLAWYQMLAQKGYMVVCVDGRGTAGRGDAFKKVIYKQMGKCEAIDQIAVANYLKSLKYVDAERIGIWGWSFGGYLSSLAMFKGEGVFKMAMAVAPVSNWRYYDNIYTERFLQTPQENPDGYDDNSPIFHANKLKGKYLLIHGMADDNVHFQNAVDLSTALIESNKQYEEFFYPNMNHFINHKNARHHLYTQLTDFILKNL